MTTNIAERLTRYNGKIIDQLFYMDQVKQIFKCSTREEADNLYKKLSLRWDPVYHNTCLLSEVDQRADRH